MERTVEAELATLAAAIRDDDQAAGMAAAFALLGHGLRSLDRIATALEKIAGRPAS